MFASDCALINIKGGQRNQVILPLLKHFNYLSSSVNQKIIKTLEVVTRLSGPKLNIPEVNDTLPTRSRSARSLIPLIGEVGSSLFGLATEGQLKTLARHVKEILDVQEQSSVASHANTAKLRSFITKSNDRMDGLRQLINLDHDSLGKLTKHIFQVEKDLSVVEDELNLLMPRLLNQTIFQATVEAKWMILFEGCTC